MWVTQWEGYSHAEEGGGAKVSKLLKQGAHAGLTKSYKSLIFVFPFVRPYEVLCLGIFDQRGLIKSYFSFSIDYWSFPLENQFIHKRLTQ